MKWLILRGYRLFDYTSKSSGKTSPACNIFVEDPEPGESSGVVGSRCDAFFAMGSELQNKLRGVKPGSAVCFLYDRYGHIVDLLTQ